jgi:O-antigen/teichoic acid export membrane protein
MISVSEAGIYSIGYTVGSLVMILVNAYFNFYTPFLMEKLADITEEKKLQVVKMSYLYGIGCAVVLILIILLAPIFFRMFIAKNYYEGVRYVFWIALGYCFWGAICYFRDLFSFLRRIRFLPGSQYLMW